MVKVFLCESATACLNQLKALCSSLKNACILVPNDFFQKNCIEFCKPNIPIFSLSQWMEILGLRPLKLTESLFLNTYDPFDDPASIDINSLNLYPQSFQQNWFSWMQANTIHSFSDIVHVPTNIIPFDSIILYGQFKTNIRNILLQNLQNLNLTCYQVLYTCKDINHKNENIEHLEKSTNFQSISIKNSTTERFFIQKFLEKNPNTICVELPEISYKSIYQNPFVFLLPASSRRRISDT